MALTEESRQAGVPLKWTPEPECWWRFPSAHGTELLKPDASVSAGGRLAWLELDRGTQSVPTTLQAKVRRYCRAARASAAAGETVPFVVFAATKPARVSRLRTLAPKWAAREDVTADVAARLFRVMAPADVPAFLIGGSA